jgi:hypothetical protein
MNQKQRPRCSWRIKTIRIDEFDHVFVMEDHKIRDWKALRDELQTQAVNIRRAASERFVQLTAKSMPLPSSPEPERLAVASGLDNSFEEAYLDDEMLDFVTFDDEFSE